MELLAGMLQQTLNVTESFEIPQRETDASVTDSPVLAASDEYSCLGGRRAPRYRIVLTLGGSAECLCQWYPQISEARSNPA